MPINVVVVDDDVLFLDVIAKAIQRELKFEPFVASEPLRAIEILQHNSIKVIIVDQRMPEMTGIDLIQRIKKSYSQPIQFIVLTAHKNEVPHSAVVGLHAFFEKTTLYVENNIEHLCQSIAAAILKYDTLKDDQLVSTVDLMIQERKAILSFRQNSHVRLTEVRIVNESFVSEQEWHTVGKAERNIESERELTIETKSRSATTHGVDREVFSKQKLKLDKIIAGVESEVSARSSVSTRAEWSKEVLLRSVSKVKTTPIVEGPNADGIYLQARQYQCAPVYVKCSCKLQIDCSFCGVPHEVNCTVLLPTNRVAMRHLEHFSNGAEAIHGTGIHDCEVASLG
ncbi:MAG: response regulator [Candidatus Zixiibacteriota bacterium]